MIIERIKDRGIFHKVKINTLEFQDSKKWTQKVDKITKFNYVENSRA